MKLLPHLEPRYEEAYKEPAYKRAGNYSAPPHHDDGFGDDEEHEEHKPQYGTPSPAYQPPKAGSPYQPPAKAPTPAPAYSPAAGEPHTHIATMGLFA